MENTNAPPPIMNRRKTRMRRIVTPDRLVRMANASVPAAIRSLQRVGDLAYHNPSREQKTKILDALHSEFMKLEELFNIEQTPIIPFSL